MPFCITKPGSFTPSKDEARNYIKKKVQAYKKEKRLLLILQITRLYVVSKTTLYNKIYRH